MLRKSFLSFSFFCLYSHLALANAFSLDDIAVNNIGVAVGPWNAIFRYIDGYQVHYSGDTVVNNDVIHLNCAGTWHLVGDHVINHLDCEELNHSMTYLLDLSRSTPEMLFSPFGTRAAVRTSNMTEWGLGKIIRTVRAKGFAPGS